MQQKLTNFRKWKKKILTNTEEKDDEPAYRGKNQGWMECLGLRPMCLYYLRPPNQNIFKFSLSLFLSLTYTHSQINTHTLAHTHSNRYTNVQIHAHTHTHTHTNAILPQKNATTQTNAYVNYNNRRHRASKKMRNINICYFLSFFGVLTILYLFQTFNLVLLYLNYNSLVL